MKISKFTAIFVVCLTFAQPIALNAQEAESRPKKTPRMTDEYSPGLRANPSPKPNDSTAQPEASNWLRYSPGNRALSLELPGELQPLEMPPPKNLQLFKEMESYTYHSDQLLAMVVYFSFNQTQISPLELKTIAAGFIQALTQNSQNNDVKFTAKLETPSRLSVNGSYHRDGVTTILNGLLVVKGGEVWMMMTGYPEGSVSSSVAVQRILNSARL
jgi:hypothetical protein